MGVVKAFIFKASKSFRYGMEGSIEDWLDRDIIVTPLTGGYDSPSGYVVELQGSPSRFRIVVSAVSHDVVVAYPVLRPLREGALYEAVLSLVKYLECGEHHTPVICRDSDDGGVWMVEVTAKRDIEKLAALAFTE